MLRFRDNAFKEYFSNPKYLKMVSEKFGAGVVAHIEEMLKYEIHRKFAGPSNPVDKESAIFPAQ